MADEPRSGKEPAPDTEQDDAAGDADGSRRFGAETWPAVDLPAADDDDAQAEAGDDEPAGTRRTRRARTPRPVAARPRAGGRARDEDVVERLDVADAQRLEVTRGSVGQATAHSLVVTQGAVGGVQADEVHVSRGAIGGVRSRVVTIQQGAIGGAVAGEVSVRQGYIQGVIARDVHIEQGGARTIIAADVTMGPQSGAFIVLARRVSGNGKVVLDWRGALAFGAGFGAILALLRRRGGR